MGIRPGLEAAARRLETLVRLKQQAGRAQDLADIAELCMIHGDPGNG